jgi:hypothetical protein
MIFGGSSAIIRQEALGQCELVGSDTLPRRMLGADTRAVLEAAGVEFMGDVEGDDQFQYAKLPAGWGKVATDHSMWSKLVDEQGRERAAIFYKAAFYDRSAHISATCRFSTRFDYDRFDREHVGVTRVFDADKIVFETVPESPVEDEPNYRLSERCNANAYAWLDEHWPDWKNAGSYWGPSA